MLIGPPTVVLVTGGKVELVPAEEPLKYVRCEAVTAVTYWDRY